MRLLRFGKPGQEKPGMLDERGKIRDISSVVPDIGPATLSAASLKRLAGLDPDDFPLVADETRLGPCVAGVGKLVAVGLNYADHAAETGMEVPAEPILFMKATSSICGPNDAVVVPPGATRMDWEVELAVVIGTTAKYVDEASALDHVAGYCIINDVSERSFQLERGGQWLKGKSADRFGPLGPWLVTRDEIPDPQNLSLWLELDGIRMQDGTTGNMIFPVAKLVSYISQFMRLDPGDVIATGTPSGVGHALKPPKYASAGQQMRLGVEGLGEQRQVLVAYGAGN